MASETPFRDVEADEMAERLMESLKGAPVSVLEEVLEEVKSGDCYRDTVKKTVERGEFFDPLGLCPDLDPARA